MKRRFGPCFHSGSPLLFSDWSISRMEFRWRKVNWTHLRIDQNQTSKPSKRRFGLIENDSELKMQWRKVTLDYCENERRTSFSLEKNYLFARGLCLIWRNVVQSMVCNWVLLLVLFVWLGDQLLLELQSLAGLD